MRSCGLHLPLHAIFVIPALLFLGSSVLAADYYRVNKGEVKTIDEFGVCKLVTNSSNNDKFIPTKTLGEWSAFYTQVPTLVTVSSCPGCALPWGGTIAHGTSVIAYQTNAPTGVACSTIQQTRTCSNGVLSGSYTNSACSSGCAAGTVDNCVLPGRAHNQAGGSCASGYSGTCSYSCDNGVNVQVQNSCSANTSCVEQDGASSNMCAGRTFSIGQHSMETDCQNQLNQCKNHGSRCASGSADPHICQGNGIYLVICVCN